MKVGRIEPISGCQGNASTLLQPGTLVKSGVKQSLYNDERKPGVGSVAYLIINKVT